MDFLLENNDIIFEEYDETLDVRMTTEIELIIQNVIQNLMDTKRGNVLWNEQLGVDYGKIFGILKQQKPSDQQPYVKNYLKSFLTQYTSLAQYVDIAVEPDDIQNELNVTVYLQTDGYEPVYNTVVKVER